MKLFKSFNDTGTDVCPICGTQDQKEVLLIPIEGTQDGNLMEAIQVHAECLQKEITYNPKYKAIVIFCTHNPNDRYVQDH